MATEQTVLSYTLPLSAPAKVTTLIVGKHDYTNLSGSKPWQIALYADGNLVRAVGGSGAYTETPVMAANFTTGYARNLGLRVTWYGESAMRLVSPQMYITVSYK